MPYKKKVEVEETIW